MTLAIMQPYLFPYIGYFQLMHAADRFVVYDDVNYIKQGWVNRNRILVNGAPLTFTLPLSEANPFATIDQISVHGKVYAHWRGKFMATLRQSYSRAPFREPVLALVERVLLPGSPLLREVLLAGLQEVHQYIGATADLVPTSRTFANGHLSASTRILDICRQEGATAYVNAIGGKDLYNKEEFSHAGINLQFLRSRLPAYRQAKAPFVPGLSILDVMMWNPPGQIKKWLAEYDLE